MTRSNSRKPGHFSLMALIILTGIALTALTQYVSVLIPQRSANYRHLQRHKDLTLLNMAAQILAFPPEEEHGSDRYEDETYSWRMRQDRSGEVQARSLTLSFPEHEGWPRITMLRFDSPDYPIFVQDFD